MRFWSMVGQASIQTARASGPSTIDRSSGLPPPLGIQAPRPRPGGGEIEPDKAEQDGGVPLIEHRPKALGRVAQEIRDGHLAREDEGHRPSEQSDEEKQAAEHLERSGDAGQRRDRRGAPPWHDGRRKREQLGRPELHEEKRGDDPEDAEQVWRTRRPFRADAWCGHRATSRSVDEGEGRVASHEPPRMKKYGTPQTPELKAKRQHARGVTRLVP